MKPFKAATLLAILAAFGLLTLGSRMMKPHQTLVLGQDLSLSYPVANTIPFSQTVHVTPRSFPWLYIFFFVPFILFSVIYALVFKRSWTVELSPFYDSRPSKSSISCSLPFASTRASPTSWRISREDQDPASSKCANLRIRTPTEVASLENSESPLMWPVAMKLLLQLLSLTLLEAQNGCLAQLPFRTCLWYDDGCHLLSDSPCQLPQRLQGTQKSHSEVDLWRRITRLLCFSSLCWQFPNRYRSPSVWQVVGLQTQRRRRSCGSHRGLRLQSSRLLHHLRSQVDCGAAAETGYSFFRVMCLLQCRFILR